jgi:C-terminal processing protease CtpA/Prc
MEKEGVMPDISIEPHPDQLARGIDVQLEKAVEVLAGEVTAWRKARPPVTGGAGVSNPGTSPPMK